MENFILSLDQGTTSSRAILFSKKSKIISMVQQEFTQIFPKPGWVEHNPEEIYGSQVSVARGVMQKAGIEAAQIAAIGITNQRETTILWEKETGRPVYNAIVWQCRRTADICTELRASGFEAVINQKTGLIIDPYFSGTKIKWILDNVPGVRAKAKKGEILFGTVDSWLIYNLTGNHYTDPSNASRTMLYNIHKGEWDQEILKILDIPGSILPQVIPSSGDFGLTKKNIFGRELPVRGVAGDQQAALFGQTCFKPGETKNTYGTGCFTLMNTGNKCVHSSNNLLTTVAWDLGQGPTYALEGSVFSGGASIQWLRDQLGLITNASESELLASSVSGTDGVYCVPAFTGLGAPFWDPEVRASLLGMTRGTEKAHIVRAVLESIAFQSMELILAMGEDLGSRIPFLRVDGGASANNFLIQFQADLLQIPVQRPAVVETTALGAAYLAGLKVGYWDCMDSIKQSTVLDRHFTPKRKPEEVNRLIDGWRSAVRATRMFKI